MTNLVKVDDLKQLLRLAVVQATLLVEVNNLERLKNLRKLASSDIGIDVAVEDWREGASQLSRLGTSCRVRRSHER